VTEGVHGQFEGKCLGNSIIGKPLEEEIFWEILPIKEDDPAKRL
jgi:hypothetical protein